MSSLRAIFREHADLALAVLVIGILTVLFVPIPPGLLDFLILSNFSFGLLVLLLSFYTSRPVEFSTFPSLLLIGTLFRLSLNVAATRLILSSASAGHVIGSIGSYVVGGNYVIGLIVFLILVVVQYVVVTSGAQRVSEVAARFTLDSMPGQQMSIDADLNMGMIDQDEAKRRRKNIEKEAGFYGAMDGASKFVKGDAIAGILILLINIVGGLVIGVLQLGMHWDESLRTYTLLTVGDGIVTQVPALIIAVGTGIIVTRSASDARLSDVAFTQLTSFPKALGLVVIALAALLFLPGLPALPLLILMVAFGAVALLRMRSQSDAATGSIEEDKPSADAAADVYGALTLEPVEVGAGSALTTFIESDQATLIERIATFRKQFATDMGLVLPRVRFRNVAKLEANTYEISLFGVPTARGQIYPDRLLAIHPSGETKLLQGIETKEPTYGLPAIWILESERATARAAKFTLIDASTVLITHMTEVLKQESAALLTRAETDRLLARVRQENVGLVEELVPSLLSVSDVQRILQNLLKEKVSIRNLEAIVEALLDTARASKDIGVLTDHVRRKLAPAICQALVGDASALQVLTLDPSVEQALSTSIRQVESASTLVVDPTLADKFLSRLSAQNERMIKANLLPILLCAPELRRHIRALSERMIPHMRVLSLAEVPNSISLRSFGIVSLNQ